jgi:predicted solute-binding protein
VGRSAAASDGKTARRLWELSEELTGVPFPLGAAAVGA